ncbi:XTP/dITP diphosphatase [Candidatus Formimonas warabiya]|uniref:dITP/XTP pyrophosphatase n=1 Tax=Formimonas warabiya TaxID=1761012 RepID=A0A3G1KSV0_FORW1|nr:XTP/dITP diphosphatase [Candidatus Formimonas warabiya]ATW25529.1 non-canonical purine NTP pyrophosphatase, RdgB/HAM1 family [Candidatus Formimonas warabiya]
MREILLATKNIGKLNEFVSLIGDYTWKVFSLRDFPHLPQVEETGTTFQDNARLKALAAAQETGLLALADDSGLEVDSLGGLPGVYSARFAGEERNDQKNNEKLLVMLKNVPASSRRARFRCTIAVARPDGQVAFCEGVCEGLIAMEPAGTNGFGYDPLFFLPEYGKTMAQLDMEEKNLISHRGKAFKASLPLLHKMLSGPV